MTGTFDYCSSDEQTRWFAALLFFAICFMLTGILCLYLIYRFHKYNPEYPCKDLTPRYILAVSILLKAFLVLFQALGYHGLDLKNGIQFVITFGGYVINFSYLSILFSWCTIFCSYIGGTTKNIFIYTRKIIIGVAVCSIIQYIITFVLCEKGIEAANIARVIFSVFWDVFVEILFIGMTIVLWKKLEIKCVCSTGPEQIVYLLCATCCVALLIRIISFSIYSGWYMVDPDPDSQSSKRSNCDTRQLSNYIIKELLGQFAPLLLVILSDFIGSSDDRNEYNNVDSTENYPRI